MAIISIKSTAQFDELLAKNQLVLIDFFATWCGPCKMLHPTLEKLSEEMKNICFMQVDVDNHTSIARKFNITAMPTIILLNNQAVVTTSVGYKSYHDLKRYIEIYSA